MSSQLQMTGVALRPNPPRLPREMLAFQELLEKGDNMAVF